MRKERPIIAVVINEANRSFFSRSLYYLQKELFSADIDVLIFSSLISIDSESFANAELDVYKLIPYKYIDGVIFYGNSFINQTFKENLLSEIREHFDGPILCVEEKFEGVECEPFYEYTGARVMSKHLIEEHHCKSFHFVAGPIDIPYNKTLLDCFKNSLRSFGYELTDDQISIGNNWNSDYRPIVDQIIAKGLPDAIICCSDVTANGIICALSSRGIVVPDDVIVTGYAQSEPYGAEYINITSVLRDSQIMSVNIARHMLSLIDEANLPYWDTGSSCRLVLGSTCGCCKPNMSTLSAIAMKSLTHTHVADMDNNYNFMQEDLIDADEIEKFFWVLDYYTRHLGPIDGFWVCLNNNILHSSGIGRGFTDTIYNPYRKKAGAGSVDFMRSFPKEVLLEDLFEHRIEPASYFVTSLHFLGKSYGYTVLSYGDGGDLYPETYLRFLRYTAAGLEKQRKQQLYTDATTDSQVRDILTGLYNMRGYHRFMNNYCHLFQSGTTLLRIISIDVENLKGINDTFGFEEGNKALCRLANMLTYSAGDDDICVRVSSDEFYIAGFLDANDPKDDVIENLNRNLSIYNSDSNNAYGLHVHVGTATAPFTSKDVVESLPYDAVYQRNMQKENRNKLIKTHSVSDINSDELSAVTRMLNENSFRYAFQPIVNAHTGEIVAYEALMRASEQYKLSPITILHYAEYMNRLEEVEKCTLFNTVDFYKANKQLFGDRKLFINTIPAHPVSDADFEFLYDNYKEYMSNFVVEFTEQTEATSTKLSKILSRSQRTGTGVAIDDYGTGYSNVNTLLNIMPDVVKLDRSLISNIDSDRRKRHFAKNIVDYAHDNHFLILAEGVETREELKTIIKMGFDLIQGYYTAHPSFELVDHINQEISDEILEFNLQLADKHIQKTYFTSSENEMSLKQLDFNNYTDIMVSKPEYTILGDTNFSSKVSIRIKDNTECKLTLKDVILEGEDPSAPCIRVGKNAKLTLCIEGCVMLTGNIRVPEHSSLTIVGDGELKISSSTEQGYAIGDLIDHSYGDINILLNNTLSIHLDSEKSVAIGGGLNAAGAKIHIEAKELNIEQTGKSSLAIGTLYGHANINIVHSKITISEHSAENIGIGSFTHSVNITATNSAISLSGSGDKLIGIGSFTQRGGSVSLTGVKLLFFFQAKNIIGIGIDGNFCSTTIIDSTMEIICEGAKVIAIGTTEKTGSLSMYRCKGSIQVRSASATIYGVDASKLQLHYCNIETSANE